MKYSIPQIKTMIYNYRKTQQYSKADRLKHILKLKIKEQKNGSK